MPGVFSKALRYSNTQFYLQTSHTCLYSPAAEYHRRLAVTHFTVPWRVEGWVDLSGWLHSDIKWRPRQSNPDTVTHPSTNQARRRLTSLINTSALPLRQTATLLWYTGIMLSSVMLLKCLRYFYTSLPPQPFYGPFSGTIRVSRCQTITCGLHGARED